MPRTRKPRHLAVVRPTRWWKAAVDQIDSAKVSAATAFADMNVHAIAYLLKRLTDDKAPDKVRDLIALTMAPKLVMQLRGHGQMPVEPPLVGDAAPSTAQSLVEDYGVDPDEDTRH